MSKSSSAWSISHHNMIILVRKLSNGHVDILASLAKLDSLPYCKLFDENVQLFNALYAQRGRGYQLQQIGSKVEVWVWVGIGR